MAGGCKITESGGMVFDKPRGNVAPDSLWKEYIQLEYEILNNRHTPTQDPLKFARYHELKRRLKIDDNANMAAFNAARERIKNEMIASDETPDNSVLYAAMTKFKNTNS